MSVWRSATSMTWLALAVRLCGFTVLLPLVLADLSDAEVSVWLLFSAIASFQAILDFGFGPTFSREISYGFAGHSMAAQTAVESVEDDNDTPKGEADWTVISSATGTMSWLYRRIALATLLLLAIIGTWVSWTPIKRVSDPEHAWLAWTCVVLTTTVAIYGNTYSAFLIGANRIALQKRWEAVTSAASLIAQATAILAGAGLLGLVLASQAGLIIQVLVNRILAFRVSEGKIASPVRATSRGLLIEAMWPAAWRTAAGTVMSLGVSQGMAIAMANMLAAAEAASVQLALRLMQLISQISQAPFYTRIPELNRIRAAARSSLLANVAAKAMRTSLWIFVVGALLVDLVVRHALALVGSHMEFPGTAFWLILTFAVFFERFGAMHVHLLLTGNRAIAHFANGATAAAWIIGLVLLFPKLGMLALPVSMLIAYAGFYAVLAAFFSHSELDAGGAWNFERRTSLTPFLAVLLYALLAWPWSR